MRGARDPITRLERAIDCLPACTRRAVLEGIHSLPIVAGAYTDGRGGVCPMLAAHLEDVLTASLERDGETDFAQAIAEHRALWYRSQEFATKPSRSNPPAAAGEAARTAS